MNRKRSNPQNLPQSKRLKTPSPAVTQGSSHMLRAPSTNAIAFWDRDEPEGLEPPTAPPFNIQDQRAVFPSMSPLAVQTDAAVSSTSELSPPQSSVHQGILAQSHEVFYGRPGDVAPSYYSDWHVNAAIEEQYQNLQGTQTEDLEGNYFQYALCPGDISAHNALYGSCNSLSERSSQPSMSLSGKCNQALNGLGASLHRPENFTPSLSMLGTSVHDPFDPWGALAEDYHISYSQSLHIVIPSEPPGAQFPVQNNMLQSAQKVGIGGNAKLMNIARDNVTNVTNVVKDGTHGLEKMERFVSFNAQFDSSAQDPERICHPGTRQNVLKRTKDWIDNPSSTERITWLHGPAGAGKSAIAQTIAQSCCRQKAPATFFFFRSDSGRNNGNMLFTTLAYQLAFSIPAIKDYMAGSLHEHPDLPTKSVEIQFNDLIALPFKSLSETASQQTSPNNIIAAFNQCQQLAPVIIIDGVDECTDEKLQQRFLKIIGKAVKDHSFPFRFLICSRPEAHIEDTLNKFKALILPIDLAKLDDANRDIEKYLIDHFSSIASSRGLDPTWPGRDVIENIVYKSSGNFILASVIIKFSSDEDSMPEDQIAIILNLKPPDRTSPFAVLDELYLEILKRQLYQDFLKTFLALLVGRTALSRRGSNLHEDDAKLMNVSEEELHTKLRRMRSLLKFEPHIDVYHRSFLDFLKEPSRSGNYHVSTHRGTKRYLELVVDSIVRYASRVIQDPDYHEPHHFNLKITRITWDYPLKIKLPIEELQGVSQPLVEIQDKILELADSRVADDLLSCKNCAISNVMRPLLLHLAMHRCIEAAYNEVGESRSATKRQCSDVVSSVRPEAMQSVLGNELESRLYSLITHLQETKLELPFSTAIINDTYSILRFDCAETAVKVRSMSNAQTLVDFLLRLIDEKYILSQYKPHGISKTARLIFNIFVRIPILPRSLCQNTKRVTPGEKQSTISVQVLSKAALMSRVLDQNYIHVEMKLQRHSLQINDIISNSGFKQWETPLDSIIVLDLVLGVARAIQYLHSMGIAPPSGFDCGNVYLDLNLHPNVRINPKYSTLINPFVRSMSEHSLHEDTIFAFGCFFYVAYSNEKVSGSMNRRRCIVAKRPSKLKIPECVWQLIQRCCAKDPNNRPTIGEVVKEMETWGNQPT